jgi:hypothetical protein
MVSIIFIPSYFLFFQMVKSHNLDRSKSKTSNREPIMANEYNKRYNSSISEVNSNINDLSIQLFNQSQMVVDSNNLQAQKMGSIMKPVRPASAYTNAQIRKMRPSSAYYNTTATSKCYLWL